MHALLDRPSALPARADTKLDIRPQPAVPPRAPDAALPGSLLSIVLDQLDHGIAIIGSGNRLTYANRAAQAEFARGDIAALQARGQGQALVSRDAALLGAIDAAAWRGLRALVAPVGGALSRTIAVVPLSQGDDGPCRPVLLMFDRPASCPALTVQCYALAHRLTPTETRVLTQLCEGDAPERIAERHHVALSTVRSQIKAIRAKTDAPTVGRLVQRLTALPPLMGLLTARLNC